MTPTPTPPLLRLLAAPVNPGQEIVYTLTFQNTGLADATNVVIGDIFCPCVTVIDTGGGVVTGNRIDFTIGTVARGPAATRSFRVRVDSLPVGPLNGHVANLAVLDSFELPPLVGGAVNGSSDLQVLKSVSPTGTVTPGATLTYTFTFTNPAPATAPATGVVMRDTIPTHTTYVSGSASDSGSLSGDVVSWPAFDVQPGATVTRTYQVTVNSPLTNGTIIPNAGSYTWDAFPPGSGGIDTNLVITPVQSAPVLTLTKSTAPPGHTHWCQRPRRVHAEDHQYGQ